MKTRLRKYKGKYGVHFYLAINGKNIGTCRVSPVGKTLQDLKIYPRYRGLGYGSILLEQVMKDKQAPTRLYAKPFNESKYSLNKRQLLRFYRKFGFERVRENAIGVLMNYNKNA
jgi:ribosomal protein S18 acetylase RimI-like enzyme